MLDFVIRASLKNRFAVLLMAGVLVAVGLDAARKLPLDAFPDTTPNQVQINTVAAELSPEQIERLITLPIELSLGGLKGLVEVRSISKFGLSQVVAIFDDETNIYFARQQIAERINEVDIPQGVARPSMGPVATGLGEVYHYYLTSKTLDLTELHTLHEWVVRPRLRRVAGVAEINTLGGLAKQYEVRIDPTRLAKYNLGLDAALTALRENNQNVGGGPVERAGEVTLVQGVGVVRDEKEVGDIVISSVDGVPIRVKDVGDVAVGHQIRRGGTTANGLGEVVLGLAFMRVGENSRDVTLALEQAMSEVRRLLPTDVEVHVVYRRTDLVNHVLETVRSNLFEGAVLVVAILFMFLGNLRAGMIVACVIPLSMLCAVTTIQKIGIAGSLMSLGAIDFGLVVDSSVVMVENCVRRLAAEQRGRSRLDIVREAAIEVRKPTMFGELIIMIVYLPILTLEGVEGKMFRPMALTVICALAGSMVLSLTLIPVLASLFLPRRHRERETIVDRVAHWLYRPMLGVALRFPRATLSVLGCVSVAMFGLSATLGSEFIPRLEEGTLVFNTIRLSSVGLDESQRYGGNIERLLRREFPDEVLDVWTRTGTAEVATDPMGLEISDVFVSLRSRARWRRARNQEQLVQEMADEVGRLPGMQIVFSQPIEQRINEMIAGIRADLGVKIFGEDLEMLAQLGQAVERILSEVPGAADVTAERISGLPVMRVEIDRVALSRYGIPARLVLDVVAAIGGIPVGEIRESERRFPLVARLPSAYRDDPSSLERILIPTPDGARIPLTRVARLVETTGASTIQREWGKRRLVVQANVRGRDVGTFVTEAQRRIAAELVLPQGYSLEWGGQFDNMIRAQQRLTIVVPIALLLTLSLLYLTFHSLRDALIIFCGVMFAGNGGILGLWVSHMPFTISSGVGFVALAGASMLMGLVLVSAIHDQMRAGISKQEAIQQAAQLRLRPVLMTGTVAALGFVPMMISSGIGAEVQRPLATVVVFGMLVATLLTMMALPALYSLFGRGPVVPQSETSATS
jgi:cobalt-zinc-cadmium resistance protein CzcA